MDPARRDDDVRTSLGESDRLAQEEAGLIVDGDVPPPRPRRASSGSVLAAAMLAVGEIIEPEKTTVEIAEEAEDRDGDGLDGLRLDFGDLPPLN